jgi:hypothetical protein
MTKQTTPERLARVEEKLQGVKDDVSEIKELLKGQEDKFVLRREALAISGVLTFAIGILTLYSLTR